MALRPQGRNVTWCSTLTEFGESITDVGRAEIIFDRAGREHVLILGPGEMSGVAKCLGHDSHVPNDC